MRTGHICGHTVAVAPEEGVSVDECPVGEQMNLCPFPVIHFRPTVERNPNPTPGQSAPDQTAPLDNLWPGFFEGSGPSWACAGISRSV